LHNFSFFFCARFSGGRKKVYCCLLAEFCKEMSRNSSNKNIWKERIEFYRSAEPKNEEEEDEMMKRALEESQKLEEERQRHLLQKTTTQVHLLYALWISVLCSIVLYL